MTKARDVYFWSESTGLMAFKAVAFNANTSRRRHHAGTKHDPYRLIGGLADARPSIFYTAKEAPDFRELAKFNKTQGLLWTTDPENSPKQIRAGNKIHDMIPVLVERIFTDIHVTASGVQCWKVEIDWRLTGPAIIDVQDFAGPDITALVGA